MFDSLRSTGGAWGFVVAGTMVAACDSSPADPGESLIVDDVVAGASFSCALVDQTAYCWGANADGQLGRGTATPSERPAPVAGNHRFRQLAAGHANVCGITDGGVLCWGSGALFPSGDDVLVPTPVPLSSTHVSRVGVGILHACALHSNDVTECWGSNTAGQHGNGTTSTDRSPTQPTGGHRFTQLSVGAMHACGVEGTDVYCWGQNFGYAIGDRTTLNKIFAQPERVRLTFPAVEVIAGSAMTCVLDQAAEEWCWGQNDVGQLGRGDSSEPTGVPMPPDAGVPLHGLVMPSVNRIYTHTCALDDDGAAWCWGAGDTGQLARTDTQTSCWSGASYPCAPDPAPIESDLRFRVLAAGYDHTCGITTDGALYCWGDNDHGELGRSGGSQTEPVRVTIR